MVKTLNVDYPLGTCGFPLLIPDSTSCGLPTIFPWGLVGDPPGLSGSGQWGFPVVRGVARQLVAACAICATLRPTIVATEAIDATTTSMGIFRIAVGVRHHRIKRVYTNPILGTQKWYLYLFFILSYYLLSMSRRPEESVTKHGGGRLKVEGIHEYYCYYLAAATTAIAGIFHLILNLQKNMQSCCCYFWSYNDTLRVLLAGFRRS